MTKSLTIALTALLMAAIAAQAHAESRILDWEQANRDGQLISGKVMFTENAEQILHVPIKRSGVHKIARLEGLYPTRQMFSLEGRLRYIGRGTGILTMWVELPDGRRFFTKTIANEGIMRRITESDQFRKITLAFNLMREQPEYVNIELEV